MPMVNYFVFIFCYNIILRMRVFPSGIFDSSITILQQSPVCFVPNVTLAMALFKPI